MSIDLSSFQFNINAVRFNIFQGLKKWNFFLRNDDLNNEINENIYYGLLNEICNKYIIIDFYQRDHNMYINGLYFDNFSEVYENLNVNFFENESFKVAFKKALDNFNKQKADIDEQLKIVNSLPLEFL